MDLRSVLDHLEDDRGILTAVYVGQEDVDGEELDHYTVMVRTPIMIRYLLPESQAALPQTLVSEWYLDDDRLFRRLTIDMGAGGENFELSLDDWGADVDIEAPTSDDIAASPSPSG